MSAISFQIDKNTQEKLSGVSSEPLTEVIVLSAGPDIPVVDADEFVEGFLPKAPCSEAVIGQIVSWVENCPKYYAKHRWKRFVQDPAEYKQGKSAVFARLSDVSNAIVEAVADIMPELEATHTTRYIEKTLTPREKMFRQDLSRPDAYFLFRERFSRDDTNPHWMDIAAAGEFSKKNNSAAFESDIAQVLWDMHQIMHKDPRRRRCFGFTIENRDFRMYSTTRSEIVASRAIDFLSSPSYIIRFFFALMYSSEEALGRDMSMTPIWNGDVSTTPQYDIIVRTRENPSATVRAKTFRTSKLISEIGAETILGRGTRVWEVHEVKDGKVDSSKTYVLKDTWVDSDRMREGDVVTEIRADAEQLKDAEEKKALLGSLLNTALAGDVLLSDGAVDCTISGSKRGRRIVKNDESFPASNPSQSRKRKRESDIGTPKDLHDAADDTEFSQKTITYNAKTHYRIVFKEVCAVLHEIKSIRKIMFMLWKACGALELLHKLGWVHRDISSGNIMLCGNHVKITDFEYAKKMTLPGKGKVHETRTGTEDFMAIEARSQRFRFLPTKQWKASHRKPRDQYYAAVDALLEPCRTPQPPKSAPVKYTWFYNPLHDLESIFWLMLYFTGNKDIVLGPSIERSNPYAFIPETEEQYRDRIVAYWNFGLTLFASRHGRIDVIHLDVLQEHLDLHPLHPAIAPLGDILCQLRAALVARYQEIERNPPAIGHDSGGTLYDTFQELLRDAVVHIQTVPFDVRVQSLRDAVEALPKSCLPDRAEKSVNSFALPFSSNVQGADEDDGQPPKSPRVSLEQKSPSQTVSFPHPDAEKSGAGETAQTKIAVPPPTRVLRSQSRKAVDAKTSPPSPRPVARTRKAAAQKPRRGKATKNHEAAKAAAKVAATKVKSKTRKGR